MTQIVLTFTFLVISLTLLVMALTVLRLHWIASRTPQNPSLEKRLASQWLAMLGAILRAVGDFLRAPSRRQIHDRKRKEKLASDHPKLDSREG